MRDTVQAAPRRPQQGSPLSSLAYHKHRELSAFLDISDRWRRLVDVMPEGVYNMVEVERFAMAMHHPGGSPASSLLLDLGIRGFTVEQVVSYLRRLHYEKPLLLLVPKEPVAIKMQPQNIVCSVNGEIVLKVEATGLPFPQYQWYRNSNQKIRDACDSVLRIPRASLHDRGVYCVYVYNEVNHVFSQWCEVQVISNAEPWMIPGKNGHHGVKPPSPPPEPSFRITRQPDPFLKHYEGDIVKIRCCAAGPSPLEYEWLVNDQASGQIKGGSNNILLIHGAKVEDTGRYQCRVSLLHQPDQKPLLSGYCHLTVGRRQSTTTPSLFPGKDMELPSLTKLHMSDRLPVGPGPLVTAVACATASPVAAGAAAGAVAAAGAAAAGGGAAAAGGGGGLDIGLGTDGATVQRNPYGPGIRDPDVSTTTMPKPPPKLKGKVALVIGNQRYYGEPGMGPLFQTESDAAELASLLTSIDEDFRVVSLINLTAHEMVAAISYFVSLLGPGIYGVFYFAGHGFQYNGDSYLLPVDIGLEEGPDQCIRAEDILYKMQSKGTKFSFLILDMCRTEQKRLEHLVRDNPAAIHSKEANYIVAHSCISSHMAYERRSEENGIYMTHMKKFLQLNRPVEDVLRAVAKSIAKDYPSYVQRPEYKSSTTEDIYLHEKIVYTSVPEHKDFALLLDKWQQAHREPKPDDEPLYCYHGLRVTLSFHAEFSNVLIVCIHATNDEKEKIKYLSIAVDLLHMDCDDLTIEDLTEKKGSREALKQVTNLHVRDRVAAPWCYRICGIQKLRKTLSLEFKIRYEYNRAMCNKDVIKEFPAPLVASLNLQNYSTSAPARD